MPARRAAIAPTAWAVFGMPRACNAGDGMFSLAHAAFQRLPAQGVHPEITLNALRLFDEMCVRLTEGQYLDMSFEDRLDVSVEDYFDMIAGKTGALLASSPEIGAVIGGAPPEVSDAYRRFGAALGRAFQLRDDILGIWGDEAVTGKSAASDILSKKKSLPVLYGLAHPTLGAELRWLYAGPEFAAADVAQVLALLDAAGGAPMPRSGCATHRRMRARRWINLRPRPSPHRTRHLPSCWMPLPSAKSS